VIRNLRRVLAARAAANAPMEIRLVCVLMRQNLQELPALVRLAHAEGVDDVFVQYLCHDFEEASLPDGYKPMRDFIHDQALDRMPRNVVADAFAAARAAASETGVTLRLPMLDGDARATRLPRCDWPWRGAYISYRGEAMPCCMVGTPDRMNFGNMLERGVRDVWSGSGYRAFREGLATDAPFPICRSCSLYRGTF
jgi:MoaA/NifB/PqqE/SkfB family radical SAM enzyme